MSTPEVRFKGFVGEWEERKFEELATRISSMNDKKELPRVEYEDIISGIGLLNKDVYAKGSTKSGIEFHQGDVLYGKLRPYLKNWLLPSFSGLAVGDFWVLQPKNTDSGFLYRLIQSKKFDEIANQTAGTKMPRADWKLVSKTEFAVPISIDEQSKEGLFFSYLDSLIILHQRKYEEIRSLKKYMLQKMFPQNGAKVPEIRFDGFTGDWEQRRLEDFGNATGGTSIESEFSENGIYKVISIGSYSENGLYNDQGIRAVVSEKTRNRILNKDDITMILNDKTASGNIIGRVLLIEESGVYVYNQRTERIEINTEKYDPLFIYEMLNAPQIRDKIIKQSQGNTQIYVNWPVISLTEYFVPQKEEQRKIGQYFQHLDHLTIFHQHKLEKMQNIKKAMLEKMFI